MGRMQRVRAPGGWLVVRGAGDEAQITFLTRTARSRRAG